MRKGHSRERSEPRTDCSESLKGEHCFLDEIGELPVEVQGKLLRALQEKEIRPVGSTKRIRIDVRVIAATNHVLEDDVRNGRFRKDLYSALTSSLCGCLRYVIAWTILRT
jgi:DNA-binding NtrC family response regulator